jgi:hypothetical protein
MSDETAALNWEIRGGKLTFRQDTAEDIPAYKTISNSIGYAAEIERIV